MSETPFPLFAELNLGEPILRVLNELGYETPSPIQAATIPLLMSNRDVLGQAQTGTGKTAAFALPILARLDIRQSAPQALVLAPTRELAIQVAEAFQRYATHIPGFHVLPIYGGQSYGPQLSALRRGVHVVVGTPGRVIDHLEKNSLDLSQVKTLVLDEADEMLRMGFIDDVETILQKTPASRQTALFSATMPSAIKRIAQTYLQNPQEVTIAAKTGTADNIRQRYWLVSGMQKLDALTRILEAETFDGMIIFARTKLGTEELAGKLQARGFSAAAINGDINQQQRERTIQMLKDGKIDILVATDVAARGLDVERISHVINYDVPHDPESYTHRIGRTGRAGRSGEAILFITPREKGLLRVIERATRQPVSPLTLPSIEAVNDVRIARFKDQIADTLAAGGLDIYRSLIEDYERERNVPAVEIAAALASMARGDVPLLLEKPRRDAQPERFASEERPARFERAERSERPERAERFERAERPERFERSDRPASPRAERGERTERPSDAGMARYRIEVGAMHGVKPGNIVGAIANEAGIDGKSIGRIDINDDHTLLDMPEGLPEDIVSKLQGVRIAGRQLHLSRAGAQAASPAAAPVAREAAPRPERAERTERPERTERAAPAAAREPAAREPAPRTERTERTERPPRAEAPERDAATRKERKPKSDIGMERYRIEVGNAHGVKPANIVGAIANEAGLDAKYIGHIEILDDHSVLDLPEGMPKELLQHLKTVWVAGQQLRISHADGPPAAAKPASGKIMLTVPKRGAERRVEDKKAGAKPHRKGGKSK